MQFAREAGPNCRLMLWLAHHNSAGNPLPPAQELTLRQIFDGLPLWDTTAAGNGLLNHLQGRIATAAQTNDADILDPNNPPGTPYIRQKKAARIVKLIENYVDDPLSATSFPLKMSDLFDGSVLATDKALRQLLLEFKRVGIYWPSNHCKNDDRLQIAAVLKSPAFWNQRLLISAAAPVLGDASYRIMFATAKADLYSDANTNAKDALRFLKDLGVTRHHPGKPHASNPKLPALAPIGESLFEVSGFVTSASGSKLLNTGNGKCCGPNGCQTSVYPYKYCELTPAGVCNSLSDECP